MPKTNPGYWAEKFSRNVVRDREAAERLGGLGWKVVTIWECECRDLNAAAQKLCEIFGIDGTNSSD